MWSQVMNAYNTVVHNHGFVVFWDNGDPRINPCSKPWLWTTELYAYNSFHVTNGFHHFLKIPQNPGCGPWYCMHPLTGFTPMVLPSLFHINFHGPQPWLLTHTGPCLTPTVCQNALTASLKSHLSTLSLACFINIYTWVFKKFSSYRAKNVYLRQILFD